ncbi:GIY-YIG catalytic domain protein [Botrimarina colliarenosi]|uniref:GIY-YIG catalytic domain protein n=1 Tax=Botrimarina colliarenosi TaxID=2528001 RepID=A0A5C6AFN0_9BACT|nr:GIY-YIG nuclease family protein [Botrimarina colliarenosi]TWT97995.1 GIY-YIG catalytic domain protein [Botrimarina colliarenosi]
MSGRSQTIEIFLPDGEPRGVRLASITTRIVQVIQAPRTNLAAFLDRSEASRVALYFLVGTADGTPKPALYIGQTEDLRGRLRSHNSGKDFWNSVVAITSRTDSFTQVHVRYLEWYCIQKAAEAKRYELVNANGGGKPHIPEPLEADVLDAFETAATLLSTLGLPIFEPVVSAVATGATKRVFSCRGPNADGRGILVNDGFALIEGSICRRQPVPSAATLVSTTDEMIEAGLLAPIDAERLRLTEDYLCSSPSQAALIVLARKANGWTEWKDERGETLDAVYRQEAECDGVGPLTEFAK